MGKTTLISEFIKGKEPIYFSARELTDKYNLDAFTNTVAERFGINPEGMQTWEKAFNVAFEHSVDIRLVLVLDNYTDACLTNKELSSIIASAISMNRQNSNMFLILCCNHMAAFDREVTGKNSLLAEHLTRSLHIKGLPFGDACTFMMVYGAEDQKKL